MKNRLVNLLSEIETLTSRNDITAHLVEYFKVAETEELQIFAYVLTGRVAPLFVSAEFNFSEKNLLKVLSGIYGKGGDVSAMRSELGDIGLVAEHVIGEIFGNSGGVSTVQFYEDLWGIVNLSGAGSVAAKQERVAEIFSKLSGLEAKYFARMIVGKLRLGVSVKTLLDALSVLKVGDKRSRDKLDLAYGVNPDLGSLVYEVLVNGIDNLKIAPIPGVPVASRLVERVKNFGEVFERLGDKVIVQPKFDGLRCQVHKGVDYSTFQNSGRLWAKYIIQSESIAMFGSEASGSVASVRLFSRNQEDMTDMFPEVVEAINSLPVQSCILDCEIVGWDDGSGTFAPFQETMKRKRKHGIDAAQEETPVRIFPFDLIMHKGESLLDIDTVDRLEKLKDLLSIADKVLFLTDSRIVSSEAELDSYFEECVSEGLEGVIVKDFKGGYEPGKRTFAWLKLKKSMKKSLVDSVDVVIMGYYKGSGKRSGFGVGALLAGVYNPETECYESATKIGTGIGDAMFGTILKRLESIVVDAMPKEYVVDRSLYPDVWVLPQVVSVVEADEITYSKVHKAGATFLEGKGLALRFPRLIEFDRDKRPEDATTSSELRSFIK